MTPLPFLASALLCLPVCAQSSARAEMPDTLVPAVVYTSVLTPTGLDLPPLDWKQANAEVAQFKNGHADILKWERAQRSVPSAAPKR